MIGKIGNKAALLLAVLLIVQIFLYSALSYSRPFSDEGDYIAQAWLVSLGDVPYRDFFNQKMPLVHFALSGFFMFLGPGLLQARLFMVIISLLQSLLIFALAKKFFGTRPALFSTAFFVAWSVIFHGFWATISPFYSLMAALSMLFAYLFVFGNHKPHMAFFLGFFLSLGLFAKQTFLFIPIAILIYFAALKFYSKIAVKIDTKSLALFFAGLAIPTILIFAYFFLNNAVSDFVNMVVFYQLSRLGSNLLISPLSAKALLVLGFFFSSLIPIAIVFFKKFSEKELHPVLILLFLWLVFAFSNALPLRGFSFHLLPLLPPMALLFGFALHSVWKNFYGKIGLVIKAALALFLVLSFSAVVAFELEYTQEKHTFAVYDEVLELVKANTVEGDKVFSFPEMPDVYYLSMHRPPTFVTFFFDLLGDRELMAQTVRELDGDRPRLIIYFKETEDSAYEPQIDAFIEQEYVLLEKIELRHPLYNFYNYAFVYEAKQ